MTTNDQRAARDGAESTGTVTRVIRLLAALADAGGPAGVGQLAEVVNLPNSTVHRTLQLLATEGFVVRDPETHLYAVGGEFYRIAARAMSAVNVPDLAQQYVRRIADRFDETTLFGLYLPAQRSLTFEARCDGSHALQYRIQMHRPVNLVWGASGKAVLAQLPPETVRETLRSSGGNPLTGAGVPTERALAGELKAISAQGYAVTESEKVPGARGIAVPVFGRKDVVGSMVLTSPIERLPHASIEEIAAFMRSQAVDLSRTLGAPEGQLAALTAGGPA